MALVGAFHLLTRHRVSYFLPGGRKSAANIRILRKSVANIRILKESVANIRILRESVANIQESVAFVGVT